MKLIRKIVFPFVPVYYLITRLRNILYDKGLKTSTSYDFPVICVGNLSVGGTGKTPMIEYLINLLKDDYLVATLSRGYKRKTEGFQLGDEQSIVETLGDEPFQFYNKFGSDILVAVDADRRNGIKQLQALDKVPEVILLDDAYQHRKVKAGFNILLSAYNNLYTKDWVLPTGNLREPRSGATRANVIVITKCPDDLSEVRKQHIIKAIKPESHQEVFFSSIDYDANVYSAKQTMSLESLNNFTLVTGIANANTLVKYLKGKHLNFDHLNFDDHHNFTDQEILLLSTKSKLLTTEKDFMRLKQYDILKDRLYYLPIKIKIDRPEVFDKLVKDFVQA
ncbi:tetraacyldisaccharide 4'-kinase [Aestuariibaculum suncheonense]|uniref:Tetraacyldisaccharide 4'-kinase n=1 Tax=Aestuariibaculum suncheonense TaxID=1028745 RepID=A0A8J6UIC0_9FLAO|nr:tetraacyldisaccharide 4'-kinase [Aestuariibaculum suncheonense]MBD0836429.1 tetraacyldisaccharide 4'-kinase [Aestuariibaculum suncheonense]